MFSRPKTDPSKLPLFTKAAIPVRFGELAAALELRFRGPLGPLARMGTIFVPEPPSRDPVSPCIHSLHAKYWWDMYHEQQPVSFGDLRQRALRRFAVGFPRGWPACESLLSERYGQATTASEVVELSNHTSAHTHLVYGPYIARPIADEFVLEWYDRQPDWAVPAHLPEVRARWLREVCERLSRVAQTDEMQRILGSSPPQSGIAVIVSPERDEVEIELVPVMRVTDLAEALGLLGAFIESWGLHMSVHRVVVGDSDSGAYDSSEPCFGAWILDVWIHQGPHAAPACKAPPAVSRRRLDARDTVRYLQIRRRS